jgi:hypothetical protein
MSVIMLASFICSAVDIIDRDQLCEGARRDIVEFCPLNVYKTACSATVNEGLRASSDRHVR